MLKQTISADSQACWEVTLDSARKTLHSCLNSLPLCGLPGQRCDPGQMFFTLLLSCGNASSNVWYVVDVCLCENTPGAVGLLFIFSPSFLNFFIYFPFFSFKWMKILKITSLYLTYWWDIWSPMVVRWMSVGQEYLMRCWHRVPREAVRSLSL